MEAREREAVGMEAQRLAPGPTWGGGGGGRAGWGLPGRGRAGESANEATQWEQHL